jgi:hypothetical protein|tara:strand:- start:1241 stop:2182 length:942 start_codon:yes stop_codon:yes gene_type:complete
MDTPLKCKICEKEFKKNAGLHIHVVRGHKTTLEEYYKKYYPKKSKLYEKTIPFKNPEDYMGRDFINREELIEWCLKENNEKTSHYIKNLIHQRKCEKNLKYSLSEIELELCNFPNIDSYKNIFGSYTKLCKDMGLENVFSKSIPKDFFKENAPEDMKIFVDTREQKPIKFNNQEMMKLDFGDYTSAGKYYDYTYIDRKSEQDLKGTLSGENFERFKKELDRAREFNSYVFVIIESSIEKIKKNNQFGPHKHKLPYIWHNLKTLSQDYKDCCQFIFAENRAGLKKIIPKVLLYGKSIWNVDLQYFINKKINERK